MSLFKGIDFSRFVKDSSSVRKLSPDDVKSGGYNDSLRVEIVDGKKESDKNNKDYLSVTFQSVYDHDQWTHKQCYFNVDQLAKLCLSVDVHKLNEGDLPGAIIGKKLEITCEVKNSHGREFVNVKSHNKLVVPSVVNQ